MAEVTRVYVRFSKQHGFKPPILKEVVFLRSKGFSNLEIAEQTGVSRNTVSSYLEKLRGMEDEQMAELMSLVGMMMERHDKIVRQFFSQAQGVEHAGGQAHGNEAGQGGGRQGNVSLQGGVGQGRKPAKGLRRAFYKQV